jgi:uncharacterized protein YqeY
MVQQQLEQDLKVAMLARDTRRVSVLRSLKSAITYALVAGKTKSDGLSDEEVLRLFVKEAKKRQESVDSFMVAGSPERAKEELAEKAIIESYLPPALSEIEVKKLVDETLSQFAEISPKIMGQAISQVKDAARGRADGALIARLVKERLQTI